MPVAHAAPVSPEALERLRRIRVPVIVQLARRMMPLASIRTLSPGSILEFEKSVEEELELLVNNQEIGRGGCVKVGENFGLRITGIVTPAERAAAIRDTD